MESFMSSLIVMGLSSQLEVDSFDILGRLPNEIGSMILRYLDGNSLLKAATVSKRWNSLCRGDKKLRQRGRLQIRLTKKRKMEQIYGTLKRSSHVPVDEITAFAAKSSRNIGQNVASNQSQKNIQAINNLRPKENILQKLQVSSSLKTKKPKSLTAQQKRRLLRH